MTKQAAVVAAYERMQANIDEYEEADQDERNARWKLGLNEGGRCSLRSTKVIADKEKQLAAAVAEKAALNAERLETLAHEPVYQNFLQHVHGFGPIYAYRLVGSLGEPWKFDNPSKVIKSAGLGLEAIEGGEVCLCQEPVYNPDRGRQTCVICDLPRPLFRPQGGRVRGRRKAAGYRPLNKVLGEIAAMMVRRDPSKSFFRRYYDECRRKYACGRCGKVGADTSGRAKVKVRADKSGTATSQVRAESKGEANLTVRACECPQGYLPGERDGKAKPHSGAMLDMKRLMVSLVWACQRESYALPAPPPYSAAFLNHSTVTWRQVLAQDLETKREAGAAASRNSG